MELLIDMLVGRPRNKAKNRTGVKAEVLPLPGGPSCLNWRHLGRALPGCSGGLWLDGTGSPALPAKHFPSPWLTFKNIKDYRAPLGIQFSLHSCCDAWSSLQTRHPYAVQVLFAFLNRDFTNRCWCSSGNVGREGRGDPPDSGRPRGRRGRLPPPDTGRWPHGPRWDQRDSRKAPCTPGERAQLNFSNSVFALRRGSA